MKLFLPIGILGLVSLAPLIAPKAYGQDQSIPFGKVCSSTDQVFAGACFTVRARLRPGADNVAIWIWPVGTRRYLGWAGAALRCPLPDKLRSLVTKDNKTVYADVVVRPVSQPQAGHMQFVCIASVSHMIVRDKPDDYR
jgi:hypothetical protein